MNFEFTTMHTMIIVTVIVTVISLHSMFLMAKRNQGLEIFATVYPVILTICVMIGVSSINNLKGFPVNGIPEGEFQLITHQQDGDKFVIFIREMDGGFRLYRVEGGEDDKNKMKDIEDKQKEGQMYTMRYTSDNQLVEEVVRLDRMFPKENE